MSHQRYKPNLLIPTLTILAVSALTACGGGAPAASGEPSESASSTAPGHELRTAAATGAAECSAGQVAWNLGGLSAPSATCSAGVSYSLWPDCYTAVAASLTTNNGCPPLVFTWPPQPNTCKYAASYSTVTRYGSLPYETTCHLTANGISVCTKTATSTCTALAENDEASISKGENGVLVGTGSGLAGAYNFGTFTFYSNVLQTSGLTCTWTIGNYPDMVVQADADWCGSTPTPSTTTYPACSLPAPRDAALCPAQPATLAPVGPGTPYSQIPIVTDSQYPSGNVDTEGCISDENDSIPLGSDPTAAVQNKWQTLTTNLTNAQAGQYPGIDNTTLYVPLLDEMKLVFEMYGNYLTAAEQQTAVNLYLQPYQGLPAPSDVPSCGVSNSTFAPPNTAQCGADPSTIAQINTEMEFCARMSDHHVSDAVRGLPAVVNVCVTQLAADIGGLRPSLLANGYDNGTAYYVGAPNVDAGVVASGAEGGVGDAGIASVPQDASADASDAAPPPNAPDPNDVCGFKTYRALYDTFVSGPISARYTILKDPRQQSDQPELLARLQLLDTWYTAITTNLYPYNAGETYGAMVQAAGWSDATTLEGALWQGVYHLVFSADGVIAPDGGALELAPDGGVPEGGVLPPTFNAQTIASLTSDALDADRAILAMLFPAGTTPPMQSGALLLVVGDALEAMSERMHAIGIYHDMGCAYLGCGAGAQTELVILMQLMASVPDTTALQNAMTNATRVNPSTNQPGVRAQWSSIYAGILADHAALESAVKSAQSGGATWSYALKGEPILLSGAATGPTQHLGGLVQSSSAAATSYAGSGLFNPAPRNRLPAGISQDNVEEIRGDISTRTAALNATVQNFDSQLTQLANTVVQEMTSTTAMINSYDQITQDMATFSNDISNLEGLRSSRDANWTGFSQMAAQYAQSVAYDPNALVAANSYGPWSLDATSAKATGPAQPGDDVSKISQAIVDSTSAPVKFTQGTIVTVNVAPGSEWAPTCALQRQNVQGGLSLATGAKAYQVDMTGVYTGPSGFSLALNDQSAKAEANQSGSSQTQSGSITASVSACAGYSWDLAVSVSVSACVTASGSVSGSQSTSDSTTKTNGTTDTAAFTSGLRLPTTPVPSAPVGSLLAVVTDAGNPTSVRSVRIVQAPATSIIVDADSNLYLLTNDIAASGCAYDKSQALTVSVSSAIHQGQELAWVQSGLGAIASFMGGLGSGSGTSSTPNIPAGSLVNQGQLTADQAAEIRSTAMVLLVQTCNAAYGSAGDAGTAPTDDAGGSGNAGAVCDISKLPPTVLDFINNYLDRQIVDLELQVQILQGMRTVASVGLQTQQMLDDYNAANAQASVASLIPEWTLRNLDTNLLQDETAQLVDSLTYDLYAVLQLRYPDVFAEGLAKDADLQGALQTLTTAQWDQPVNDLAFAAVKAATDLYNDTATLETTYPPVTPKVVALDFARPGLGASKQLQQWTVTDQRAQNLWNQATTPPYVVDVQIEPTDLYHAAGGLPGYLCDEEVPVVLDMALVLGGSTRIQSADVAFFTKQEFDLNSWLNPNDIEFPMAATYDENDNLYSAGGPLYFTLKNLDWSALDTQVLVQSDPGQAIPAYNAARSDTTKYMNGKGLSPFSDFSIDLSALYKYYTLDNIVSESDHFIIVMNTQYRQVALNKTMSWIRPNCQ